MSEANATFEELDAVLKDRSAQQVLDELYSDDAPYMVERASEILTILEDVARRLPAVQQEIIGKIDAVAPVAMKRVLLLRAGLLAARGNTLWLHYQLMVALNALGGTGLLRTKAPLLLHAMLAMANIDEADYAQSLVGEVLSAGLLRVSPNDCMRYALSSIDHGGRFAFWMIQRTFARYEGAHELGLGLRLVETARQQVGGPARNSFPLTHSEQVRPVRPASTIELRRPAGDDYYLFREERLVRQRPAIDVHSIEGGTISVRTIDGSVEFYTFDKDRNCIESLSSGFRPFIAEDVQYSDGRLAMLSDQFSTKFNVCHFLLDHFSRIALYEDGREDAPRFLSVVNNAYCIQAFGAAVAGERILTPPSRSFSIRADELLMSSNLVRDFRHPAHLGDDWAMHFIRSTIGAADRPGDARIFISREDAGSRKIRNWEQIEPLVRRHGFEIVKLDGMSLAEQAALFATAGFVVGVHGAGLTNLAFSAAGTKVLEILPPLVATDAYWILSSALGHDYRALVADDLEFDRPDYKNWDHRPEYNDRDITIDQSSFEDALFALLN